MSFRRVNITRDENISNHGALLHHPNVRNCIRFPWGYTLFEFFDPLFDAIDAEPMSSSMEIRSRAEELMSEERKLLRPLYKGRPSHWQGNQLGLPLKTGVYRVLGKKKVEWPWFGSSPGWECEKEIKVSGRFRNSVGGAWERTERVFGEWSSWAVSTGRLAHIEQLVHRDEHFTVLCSFSEVCCDACLGLYLLLAQTRKETFVDAVGFFQPDETALKFYEIGGAGVRI